MTDIKNPLTLWGYTALFPLISAGATYHVVSAIAPGVAYLGAIAVLSAFLSVFLIVENSHQRLMIGMER